MLNWNQLESANIPEMPTWFALHTRSRHEKKVAEEMQGKGITAFLPLISRVNRWSDRQKEVQLPLFPGYVFVHTTSDAQARISVLRTSGVAGFVGSQGRGTPIPDKQIEDIRLILDQKLAIEPYPYLEVNQRVRIRGGALDGVEGTLVAKNMDRSLVVSIDLIHRSVSVRVSGYELEPV